MVSRGVVSYQHYGLVEKPEKNGEINMRREAPGNNGDRNLHEPPTRRKRLKRELFAPSLLECFSTHFSARKVMLMRSAAPSCTIACRRSYRDIPVRQ